MIKEMVLKFTKKLALIGFVFIMVNMGIMFSIYFGWYFAKWVMANDISLFTSGLLTSNY